MFLAIFVLVFTKCVLADIFSFEVTSSIAVDVAQKLRVSTCVFVTKETRHLGTFGNKDVLRYKTLTALQFMYLLTAYVEDTSSFAHITTYNNKFLYIIMVRNGTTQHSLKQITDVNCSSNSKWLLFLDSDTSLHDFFKDSYVPFDSDFLVVQKLGATRDLSLTMVYHIHVTRPLKTIPVAKWSDARGVVWRNELLDKPNDLEGIVFNVTGVDLEKTKSSASTSGARAKTHSVGVETQIMEELQQQFNFTSHVILAADKKFGTRKNGSWNGMVALLSNGEVTLGSAPFDYTKERMEAVDYLPPIWLDKITVFIREPDMAISGLELILSPFAPEVWLVVTFTVVILIATLATSWHISNIYSTNKDINSYSFYNAMLYVFGTFCQQGHDVTPRSWPCRLVYLTTYLTAIVVFVGYSATFISYLSIRKLNFPFTNFNGLLDDGTYRIIVGSGTAYASYFSDSKDKILTEIYKKLIEPNFESTRRSNFEYLKGLCEIRRTGYVSNYVYVQRLSRLLPCTLIGLRDSYFIVTTSLIISKANPFRRIFSRIVQDIRRAGLLKRMINVYTSYLVTSDVELSVSVKLGTVSVFFLVLVSGIIVSLLLLCLEILVYKLSTVRRVKS